MNKRSIGQNLRELREKTGDHGKKLTQQGLADLMGVEKNTVYKWETDKVQLNAEHIVRLADFYGISTDELLRGGKAESLVMINETGLSDHTIDRLRAYKAKGKTEYAEMINQLCDTRFTPHKLLPSSGELLLSAMYAFIHCEDLPIYDRSEKGGKYIASQADLYQLRIINELQQLRADCQKSREQEKESDDQGREVIIMQQEHIF